jgi:hypothetical protein
MTNRKHAAPPFKCAIARAPLSAGFAPMCIIEIFLKIAFLLLSLSAKRFLKKGKSLHFFVVISDFHKRKFVHSKLKARRIFFRTRYRTCVLALALC